MALIDLDDAKLSLGLTTSGSDDLLQAYVDAATAVIEDIVGPVGSGTRTVTLDGGAGLLTVPGPITGVTSVTVNGTAVATTGYYANLAAGILYYGASPSSTYWPAGMQNVVVAYTVGSDDDPPANLKLAARELVRFWWQNGQQGNRPGFGDAPDDAAWTGAGYAVPRRVMELCAPNRKPPGIA